VALLIRSIAVSSIVAFVEFDKVSDNNFPVAVCFNIVKVRWESLALMVNYANDNLFSYNNTPRQESHRNFMVVLTHEYGVR
jgi:hypothetical protein